MEQDKTDRSIKLRELYARIAASKARQEAELGPAPDLSPEELDRSQTEIHNHLRRGRGASTNSNE